MIEHPTIPQIEMALDVLLWLHELRMGDGRLRDEISVVRSALDEEIDRRLTVPNRF